MKNWLHFGGDRGILRWVNEPKNTIIVVAYPDRGAGNDPKLFFFVGGGGGGWGGGSLSPPRLNIFTVANMGVMICLDQGSLRSLSASSYLLGKGGYVFGSVGLFVCLSVCLWTTLLKKLWTDWDEILWRGPGCSTRKYWLNFNGDLGILRWVNEQKNHHNSGGIPRLWCQLMIPIFFFWGGGGV